MKRDSQRKRRVYRACKRDGTEVCILFGSVFFYY